MAGKTIVVAGAGGTIGSHFVPHLARMREVRRVVLIDRDVYESRNLENQDIHLPDVGKPKVQVQARRIEEIRSDMEVIAIRAPLETVPLGLWRSDLIVAALDSRAARQTLNERAWRLGIPWVDSGVLASECLARVNVYVPGEDAPCLECAWSAEDYKLLEQQYPCGLGGSPPPPTGAASALGALAASLAALEIKKLLEGETDCSATGRQVTWNARWHRSSVMRFRRNPSCRFDHGVWRIEPLRCRVAETQLKDLIGSGATSVAGHVFTRRRVCALCGRTDSGFHLDRVASEICCGQTMATPGFDVLETLDGDLPPAILELPLSGVGLTYGDVVKIDRRYLELTPEIVMEQPK